MYQAGATRNHNNKNIHSALQAGAQRIANGLNILQFSEIIPRCNKVCFEVSPIFQFLSRSSGREDFRISVGVILQGLKVPVSVGWDYGGLLGLQTCNADLCLMAACSSWSLKELKLALLHSVQYSSCTEGMRVRTMAQWS